MGPNIIKAVVLEKYCIEITLEDGRIAHLDMEPYLEKEMYRELKNVEMFNDFEIFYDTIRWANGADVAPENILRRAK